jgi:hypothetical protein
MIRLYQGSGSGEIQLLGQPLTPEDWRKLRAGVVRLLKARGCQLASELLSSIPFELHDGTNSFGDEFSLLYLSAPLEQYVEIAEKHEDPKGKQAFREIAESVTEVGPPMRFIAVALDAKAGPPPVTSPLLEVTSDAIERALADAEQLIHSRGAVSGVDRVHTAFHGYLRAVCVKLNITVPDDAGITQLFKLVRDNHSALAAGGPRADDIDRIARAMATILDSLNPLRNRASVAHPNDTVLGEPEAMLVINTIRTLLHYLNAKLA